MTYFLFPRQDAFITNAQQLLHATWDLNPSNRLLFLRVLDAFQHAYVVTFAAIRREDRKAIDTQYDKVSKRVDEIVYKPEREVSSRDMAIVRREIFYLFRMLYSAQQNVGLGVPKEDRLNPRGKIRAVGER